MMKNCGLKDFQTSENSIEFPIHGSNLVFIHENQTYEFYWVDFNIKEEIYFQLGELLKKISIFKVSSS